MAVGIVIPTYSLRKYTHPCTKSTHKGLIKWMVRKRVLHILVAKVSDMSLSKRPTGDFIMPSIARYAFSHQFFRG